MQASTYFTHYVQTLNVIVGFLVVFRTQLAYQRYWEGRSTGTARAAADGHHHYHYCYYCQPATTNAVTIVRVCCVLKTAAFCISLALTLSLCTRPSATHDGSMVLRVHALVLLCMRRAVPGKDALPRPQGRD